jgi:hypothetical protein
MVIEIAAIFRHELLFLVPEEALGQNDEPFDHQT